MHFSAVIVVDFGRQMATSWLPWWYGTKGRRKPYRDAVA